MRYQVKLLKSLHKVGKEKKRKWQKASKISDRLQKKFDKLTDDADKFELRFPFMKQKSVAALKDLVWKNQNKEEEEEYQKILTKNKDLRKKYTDQKREDFRTGC